MVGPSAAAEWNGVDRAEQDTPSLETAFRRHAGDVFRLVSRLLGPSAPKADVEDLTQQVFIAAHRGLPRFRGDSALSTWIYGITTRTVLQYLRTRHRYQQMIDRFETAVELTPNPAGLEEEVAQRQALRQVWGALLRMKPEHRVVFVLFEVEGMSVKEVAAVVGAREEAIRSRLRRARADLTRRLAQGAGR